MEDQQQQLHEAYEPGSDKDIHVTSIVFVGIIGAVLTVVIVMLLKALYYETLNQEVANKQGRTTDQALSDLRGQQMEQLARYSWVDAKAGKVGIPIDEAMKLVVTEQSARPNNGIEIMDWDHHHSDLNPTPGNLVLLGQGMAFNSAPVFGLPKPAPIAPPVENVEGAEGEDTASTKHEGTAATGGSH